MEPVIVNDLLADPAHASLVSIQKGIRAQLSVPILLKGEIFGTLNLGSMEPHTYTEEHAVIFQPIAQQIGAVIDRVHLFQQVTQDSTYIHNLLDSIDSVVYTVDREFRITEVNRTLDEFVREMATAPMQPVTWGGICSTFSPSSR